jgi:hypothetical protein
MPDVTGGIVSAIEYDSVSNKIYIAGDFTQVGSTPRKGFAVLDMSTGNVLPDFSNITIDNYGLGVLSVNVRMKLLHNKLYIGGVLNAYENGTNWLGYLFYLDLSNGSSYQLYANSFLSDFKLYNNKIYTTGANSTNGPSDQYMACELDTMGNLIWQKSISANPGDELFCVDVRGNNLFIGGQFSSFGGQACTNLAKVNLPGHTISSWTVNPLPGSGNSNCFIAHGISIFPNDILLNIHKRSCASPQHNTGFYSIANGLFTTADTALSYQADNQVLVRENDTSFWYYNNNGLKLYSLKKYVATWSPVLNGSPACLFRKSHFLFIGGSFTTLEGNPHKGFGVYCLAPEKPQFTVNPATVCREDQHVVFNVASDPEAVSYQWSYNSIGVTINGSGSTINLDFNSGAVSGDLIVKAVNACGAVSQPQSTHIQVYPLPYVTAGQDVHFTCVKTTATMNGGPVSNYGHYTWNGPGGYYSTSPVNAVTTANVQAGDYVFTVFVNATGCHKSDTMHIYFDTLRPVVNHLTGNYVLTCKTTSFMLDASANYSSLDTLHWYGQSFSQNNPAIITNAGTYYLSITSGANGCKNIDSIIVTSNTATPIFSFATADTITCLKDSILLSAHSGNANAVFFWTHASDTLLNNAYVRQPGAYQVHVTDTLNGCSSSGLGLISQYTTPPSVQILPGSYQINCSYDTCVLNGTSFTPGTILLWSDPNSFSSANPAIATQQGIYFLTATNSQNGCSTKDSVFVTKQNVLIVHASSDTTICKGSSSVIHSNVVGGMPGFVYSWNNSAGNSPYVTVSPADTTEYIVTITDSAGCSGKDTVIINVPAQVSDSVASFMPCDPNHPNGQIQIYATGGIAPYQYAINNSSFQSGNIFQNLSYGTYTIAIRDVMGCSSGSVTYIDNTSFLPAPDFILSTHEIRGDTFVIVDISNPRPDSVSWIFPANCTAINQDLFAPEIIHSDTGAMQITMNAWFGTCQMMLTKNISVKIRDTSEANDHNANGIKSINLYPNPNNGNFSLDVSFYKPQSFAIFIFDANGHELMRIPQSNTDFVNAQINLHTPVPGTYLLKVVAEYDSKSRTFLISQ